MRLDIAPELKMEFEIKTRGMLKPNQKDKSEKPIKSEKKENVKKMVVPRIETKKVL